MTYVYKHDDRPWIIGYSGGKDSSLLVSLTIETVLRIPEYDRTKKFLLLARIRVLKILLLEIICILLRLKLMIFQRK